MQPVLDYLAQHQQRFLQEFCDYLRFPSVSAQPQHKKDLHACAEWLVAHCRAQALPIVINSQCLSGGVDLATYELGAMALEAGAISGGFHTRWASLAKLSLLLGVGAGMEEVRRAFTISWAGEPV